MSGDGWWPGFIVPPRDHPVHEEIETFCKDMQWTMQSYSQRMEVVERISGHVKKRLEGVKVELFGSTKLKTYLPDGDIDITLCQYDLPENTNTRGRELEVLRTLVNEILPSMISQPAELINAEVKLVKCVIDGLQVDVTIDQYGGLTTIQFLDEVNTIIGCDDIFKRSLVLIKGWAMYEAHVLGANCGLLGSYSITVMLIAVFQQIQPNILPTLSCFDILQRFLEYYAAFDFSTQAVSVLGSICIRTTPLPDSTMAAIAAAVSLVSVSKTTWFHPPGRLDHDFFRECRKKFTEAGVKQGIIEAAKREHEEANGKEEISKNEEGSKKDEEAKEEPTGTEPQGVSQASQTTEEAVVDVGTQCEQKADPAASPALTMEEREAKEKQPLSPTLSADEIINITALEPLHFPIRSHNIMDPLRQNNNLGRSISRGNGSRVQSAFRQSSVELQYLCHKMGPTRPRAASYQERNWIQKWVRHRRTDNILKMIYGDKPPPDTSSIVKAFFRRCASASEKRAVKEQGVRTVGVPVAQSINMGVPMGMHNMEYMQALARSRGTQTSGVNAVGVQTPSGKVWGHFPGFATPDPLMSPQGYWWGRNGAGVAYEPTIFDYGLNGDLEGSADMHHHHHHHHHHPLLNQGHGLHQPAHTHHPHHHHPHQHPLQLQYPQAAHHHHHHHHHHHIHHHRVHQPGQGHGNVGTTGSTLGVSGQGQGGSRKKDGNQNGTSGYSSQGNYTQRRHRNYESSQQPAAAPVLKTSDVLSDAIHFPPLGGA
eukprot:TRINITY_DN2197_c0_g2_i2.p1 TRINITY_DN2197_c0_g2~~TRINITY_DN2197_c0_g2_i2.p1  ORF type:complete len:765 (+),score=169.02 TRINITY_DN2197_c0_g2_i2:26-2320(+)